MNSNSHSDSPSQSRSNSNGRTNFSFTLPMDGGFRFRLPLDHNLNSAINSNPDWALDENFNFSPITDTDPEPDSDSDSDSTTDPAFLNNPFTDSAGPITSQDLAILDTIRHSLSTNSSALNSIQEMLKHEQQTVKAEEFYRCHMYVWRTRLSEIEEARVIEIIQNQEVRMEERQLKKFWDSLGIVRVISIDENYTGRVETHGDSTALDRMDLSDGIEEVTPWRPWTEVHTAFLQTCVIENTAEELDGMEVRVVRINGQFFSESRKVKPQVEPPVETSPMLEVQG